MFDDDQLSLLMEKSTKLHVQATKSSDPRVQMHRLIQVFASCFVDFQGPYKGSTKKQNKLLSGYVFYPCACLHLLPLHEQICIFCHAPVQLFPIKQLRIAGH